MRRNNSGGLVYSTDSGRMCPVCRLAIADCRCGAKPAPVGDGTIRVSRETKGRGGKTVTIVRGADGDAAQIATLGRQLRSACGSGGTVKDGVIEVQGDHADRIVELLRSQGRTVKRCGG